MKIDSTADSGTREARVVSGDGRCPPSPAARLCLDRMWAIAAEAKWGRIAIGTATMLFAVGDLVRAEAFPGSSTTRFVRRCFVGHWPRLAELRARYVAGEAQELSEPFEDGRARLSQPACDTLYFARLLAQASAERVAELRLSHLWLALLLHPSYPQSSGAQRALQGCGLDPTDLLSRWEQARGRGFAAPGVVADPTDPAAGSGPVRA